jgi:predicted RNase H-like HicB family nuclease
MEKKELDIILVPEGEGKNKIYSISSIQFPNVVTQGKSINEARIRLKEALKLYFDDPSQKSL